MFHEFQQHLEERGLVLATRKSYQSSWNRFEKWFQAANSNQEENNPIYATQKDIADFKRNLLVAGGREGKPASPATNNLTFVHLNAIFRFFADKGYIPDNPVGTVKKPPVPRRLPKWLTRNEQNALLRDVRNRGSKRDNAIILTFLRLGLRVHEVCDLELTDISMSERKGTAYIRGKGDKDRELPISAELRRYSPAGCLNGFKSVVETSIRNCFQDPSCST
ncbi:tyrosine-type recombinase/integrase [Paenibacillus enshidis]|uniref:Tyrosine-type recombinase/integrase n=1 Tax=Paenibacillus enshidis TaxID=1458439 RepID=A0ABV5AV76_9BACL